MSTLLIQGSIAELPNGGVSRVFDHRVGLAREAERRVIVLGVDTPVVVSLDGWTGINVLEIQSDTQVTARITWADASEQDLPVDPLLFLISRAKPITALSLVRAAGQSATVNLTLGQEA